MTLCDASPLIALIDRSERENHRICVAALKQLSPPLITTWPCFTEAMYFLGGWGGFPFQRMLWRYVETQRLYIHLPSGEEIARMAVLMEKWSDRPLDLADASLVTAAEALGTTRIFTLGNDFRIYRINGITPFDVVP
jgi:predicted nucleic acid-binding protein